MARHEVARVDEIAPGGRKIVEVDGISIGLFNVAGEFFALRNWCPHQGAKLCEGTLWSPLHSGLPGDYVTEHDRTVIACIWHGWEFDLRTGQSLCEPARLRVRAYDVHIGSKKEMVGSNEPGDAHSAETYPVDVQGDTVYIETSVRTVRNGEARTR